MNFSFRPALFALSLLIPFANLPAQTIKLPSTILFTGVPAYSQSDLLKVAGLSPGAISSQAEVQAAAQHLSDTGLFADIRFQSDSRGLVYALKPMPAADLVPARFTNFVWWSAEDLAAALKSRVPLYTGVVPLAGNTQDSITAALKAMLAEKGVSASVVAIPDIQPGATATAVSFAIDTPQVIIHSLAFTQASADMLPKLDAIIKRQTGQPFDQNSTRDAIADQLVDIYRDDGYLDIALVNLTHPEPKASANSIDLDLTATIREGEPYRLTSITFAGSDLMSAANFDKTLKLKPEDVASQQSLRKSLAPLANAYYVKGFQDVKIQAPATLDRATHHVSYIVTVIPGEQYRFHSIKTAGLTADQQKQFDSAWKMQPGDFYDVIYLTEFLKHHAELSALRGYSAVYKAYSDTNTHLVDIVLTFKQGGSLVEVNAN